MPFSKFLCFCWDTPSESEIPAGRMTETVKRRWSRSRYPLQTASEQAVLAPRTTTESSGKSVSSPTQRSGLTNSVHTMNIEHQSVARDTTPEAFGDETSIPLSGASQAVRGTINRLEISPLSKASFPTSTGQNSQSLSDNTRGIQTVSLSPPYDNEDQALSKLNSQAQAGCPFKGTALKVQDSFSTIPSSKDHALALESGSLHLDTTDTETTTKKTLRRTPRSWSLREVASGDLESKSGSEMSHNSSERDYVDDLPQDQWKRQVYPLASEMLNMPVPRSEELPASREELVQSRDASLADFPADQRPGLTPSSITDQFQSWSLSIPGHETEDASQELRPRFLRNTYPSKNNSLESQDYLVHTTAVATELLEPPTPSSSTTGIEHGSTISPTELTENTLSSQWEQSSKPGTYRLQAALKYNNLWSPQTHPLPIVGGPEIQTKEMADPVVKNHRKHSATRGLRRGAYPLQSPASVLDLKASRTPQASSVEEGSIPGEEQALEALKPRPTSDRIQTFNRRTYPLQSPASVLSLHAPAPPQPAPTEDHLTPAEVENAEDLEPQPVVGNIRTLNRRGYPLQSPASVLDLRNDTGPRPRTAKINSVPIHYPQTDDVQGSLYFPHDENKFRRQIYPLEASASAAKQERPPTPPLLVDTSHPADEFSQHWPKSELGKRTPHRVKSTYNQSYPSQSPASIPALRLPPSPSPSPPPVVEVESRNETGSSAHLSRQKALASKVIRHWRRQVYPLQSTDSLSPFQRAPTPQPLGSERDKPHRSEPIHLPKNIRAVKEVGTSGSDGRTIVVCLDGTGDKFDGDNSNIVHLISALKKDDPKQVSYYQAGIGTYTQGGLSSGMSAALDMAVGSELGLHVRDAYHFLMHTYKEGDKICIFGFSRGAYTARCLAGMIHKVGLLPPRNIQQIAFAYEFYTNDTAFGWEQSGMFKATFSIDISVHFLGCFDSVASVGFIPRQLPLSTTPGNKPRYFRHAMALDERRAKFKVCRHQTWDPNKPQEPERAFGISKTQTDVPPWDIHVRYGEQYHPNVTDEEYERLAEAEDEFDTDVLEVWFAGAHADVGGGAVANDERHKLAQIPLRWMIRQAFDCDTGIIFKTKKLAEFGLDVHTLWPKYKSLDPPAHGPPPSVLDKYDKGLPPRSIRRSKLVPIDKVENGERFYHLKSHTDEDWTPELVEDFFDAMSPLNDQLEQAPRWWILEVWPVEYKVPIGQGQVETRVGMNLGRYRAIDDMEPKLHWTVRHREQHMGYKIRGRTAPHTQWSVVA
ncbi:hypothetical protein LTR84_002793 [Exophiala bonariae]|uniref:T6SS Phospholipase effector Tle1-like catalytic domain-containing protein n=1 Tax=Exophiala bonariae TaxID=1690606 RepID=A0AAV9N8U0_9EURO|nr:hypothetical protein LTR84_002793 [Exophiala bonariae]